MTRAIYVVRSEPGPVKVGIAANPCRRVSTLRTSSAVPLHLDFAAETDGDALAVERRAHAILASRHLTGEWFGASATEAVAAVLQAAEELGLELRPLDLEPERPFSYKPRRESLPVSFRLPPAVKAAAERAAKDDTRSLSSYVEKLLTEHLKAKGYLA